MALLYAAASGFTLPSAAPGVVMVRPQFSAATAPVMMAKKEEYSGYGWSLDSFLKTSKDKFVGGTGIELLSGVSRPINGKTVKTDAKSYACQCVEKAEPQDGTHLAACCRP